MNNAYVETAGSWTPEAMPLPAAAQQKQRRWSQTEGLPLPLGATWIEEEQALHFAVCAGQAETVTLFLYSPTDLTNPTLTFRFDSLRNKSGRVWHCRIPLSRMRNGHYYAYSVSGQSVNGSQSFDHEKILLDPYAKGV